MHTLQTNLKANLDSLAAKYNVEAFVDDDPVQFPRRYSDLRDIEIAAYLISIISWGRRAMILRDSEKLLQLLDNQPFRFVTEGNIDSIPDSNIHRTFFGRHLRYALRGLRQIYKHYGSLEALGQHIKIGQSQTPAWQLAKAINDITSDANCYCGVTLDGPTHCLPEKVDDSALKRLNMALRWLVRNDGIVDMGVWTVLRPSQLFIPLDVHSGNSARTLGLLKRRANDFKAVVELTDALRQFNPSDPIIYDFALFGAGESGEMTKSVLAEAAVDIVDDQVGDVLHR